MRLLLATVWCAAAIGMQGQLVQVEVSSGPCLVPDSILALSHVQVTGRVIDDLTEAPMAGATVTISAFCVARPGDAEERPWVVITDKDGHFTFDNIPATYSNIAATKDGYVSPWAFRRKADDPIGNYDLRSTVTPIVLRLAPFGSISGVVRDENGHAVGGAWVTLEHDRPWAGFRGLEYGNTYQTAADGSYRFPSLGPGRYYVVAQAWLSKWDQPDRDANGKLLGDVPQRYPASGFLHVAEGEQARVDFQFHREVLHHVTASVVGGSKFGSIVEVVDANGSKAYRTSQPGVGREWDAWLPNGSYRIESQFSSADGAFAGSLPIEVADADVSGLAFALTSSAPTEVSIDIRSVAPPGATCCCVPKDPGCGFWYLQAVEALANGSYRAGSQSTQSGGMHPAGETRMESIAIGGGSYLMAVLTTGNVYAQSIVSGNVDLVRNPLVVRSGGSVDPIHIVLAEAALLPGTVTQDEKPRRAWVYAIAEQPVGRLLQPVLSDPNGRFELRGLAPASYLLFASDVELSLDVHDADDLAPWRKIGKTVRLQAGSNPPLKLAVFSGPQ